MNSARNFFELFAATAERHAARVAIEVQRRGSLDRFTYAQLREMAARVAADLAGRGFCAGDGPRNQHAHFGVDGRLY